MRRRSGSMSGYLNPIVLVGIALSVALGLAFDLTGAASGPESVLGCLVGVVITLILDTTARAEERFELRALVQSDVREEVRDLARIVREIEENRPAPEITAELRRRMRELQLGLADLRDGRIVRPGSDLQLLLSGTDGCRERIEAVTNVMSPGAGAWWWRSEAGRRYWAANLAALARGVAITRVFICAEADDEVRSLIAEQRAAGVDARLVLRADVPPDLHVNLVLWDRRRGWIPDMNAQGAIVQHVVSAEERVVERLRENFDRCMGSERR